MVLLPKSEHKHRLSFLICLLCRNLHCQHFVWLYEGLTSTFLLYDVFNLLLICLFTPHFSPVGDAKHNHINLKVASLYFTSCAATRGIQACCRSIWCAKSAAHVSLFWLHCVSCIGNADIHSSEKKKKAQGHTSKPTFMVVHIGERAHSRSFVNLADG